MSYLNLDVDAWEICLACKNYFFKQHPGLGAWIKSHSSRGKAKPIATADLVAEPPPILRPSNLSALAAAESESKHASAASVAAVASANARAATESEHATTESIRADVAEAALNDTRTALEEEQAARIEAERKASFLEAQLDELNRRHCAVLNENAARYGADVAKRNARIEQLEKQAAEAHEYLSGGWRQALAENKRLRDKLEASARQMRELEKEAQKHKSEIMAL